MDLSKIYLRLRSPLYRVKEQAQVEKGKRIEERGADSCTSAFVIVNGSMARELQLAMEQLTASSCKSERFSCASVPRSK